MAAPSSELLSQLRAELADLNNHERAAFIAGAAKLMATDTLAPDRLLKWAGDVTWAMPEVVQGRADALGACLVSAGWYGGDPQ